MNMDFNRNPVAQETADVSSAPEWNLVAQASHQLESMPDADVVTELQNSELFSPERQREVMDSIAAPTDAPGGVERVMQSLSAKHELRILARMSHSGFDNWDRLSPQALNNFLSEFPSPAEFDQTSSDFLDEIGDLNGEAKRAQYEQAMASFKHKIYGEKQVYWEQMQLVNSLREQPSLSEPNDRPLAPGQHQIERSAEWTSGTFAASQISRAQTALPPDQLSEGIEATPECQDAFLTRPDRGVFGVFDGAGGHDGGREASHAAAGSVNQACDQYNLKSGADLAYVLNEANQPVRAATGGNGYTTAVLAKVVEAENGQKNLAYASVGDSRIYLVHADGTADLITRDEGEGRHITNALGIAGDDRARQYGEVAVTPGDRVVLCSDGITGDFGRDLMGNDELGRIVHQAPTPESASSALISSARKADDRTAVVFAV